MNGLHCPKCGSPVSSVRETKAKGKVVVRKRACENGHPYETQEKVTGIHRREKIREKALKLLERCELPTTNPYYLSFEKICEMLAISRDTLYRIKRGDRSQRQLSAKESEKRKRAASLISKPTKEHQDDQNCLVQERT